MSKIIDYPKNRALLIIGGIGSLMFFIFTYFFIMRMGIIEIDPIEYPFMAIRHGIEEKVIDFE